MFPFIPGLDLNEAFFTEVVRPLLADAFPQLRYSAARVGSGSDVLGYDTPMSMDHDWGIRLHLFLSAADAAAVGTAVHDTLSARLPHQFRGFPVGFGPQLSNGSRVAADKAEGPVAHQIAVTTLAAFWQERLGLDPAQPLRVVDWLATPQQRLLEVTAGRVFWDGLGTVEPLRARLAFYPRDVWLYLLACQWARIGEEAHLLGRAGQAGDALGARLLAARLVHDVMQLCFWLARRYAPYPKWFGTAFQTLSGAETLSPLLAAALDAPDWQTRQDAFCTAAEWAAQRHNDLAITPPIPTARQMFYERPFCVLPVDDIIAVIRGEIVDDAVRALDPAVGSVDQFSHSTRLRSYPHLFRRLDDFYTP